MKNTIANTESEWTDIIDKLFNSSLSDMIGADFTSNAPAVNIIEDDERYSIQLAAPGLEKSDFSVKIDKDHLIISSSNELKASNDNKDTGILRKEYSYTNFKRSFYLPKDANKGNIEASYINGILNVIIRKVNIDNEKATKTIEIK